MGCANTRPFLEESEMGLRRESPRERAKRLFTYSLYRWCAGEDGRAKRRHHKQNVLRYGNELDTLTSDDVFRPLVAKHLPHYLVLLRRGNQIAWLRLLLWLGRNHDQFGMFKELSPFAGKTIAAMAFSGIVEDSTYCPTAEIDELRLPSLDRLWPADCAENKERLHAILVIPKGAKVSPFAVEV